MSAAIPLSEGAPSAAQEAEATGPASEPSRPTNPWQWPIPSRETLSGEDQDFDFHDTIPAPPWLGDGPDTEDLEEPPPTAR